MEAQEGCAWVNCSASTVAGTCWPREVTVGAELAVSPLCGSKALVHAVLDCVTSFLATPVAPAVGRRAGLPSLVAGTVRIFTVLRGVRVRPWN